MPNCNLTFGALLGLFLLAVGCREAVTVTELPPGEQNLRTIAMAYTQFATDTGRGPRDWEELRPMLTDFGDPDQLTRSPRDGQPYRLVSHASLQTAFEQGQSVLAYEQMGVDGVRQVIDLRLTVSELDAAAFAQLQLP